ncbi:MAG: molybdenum cofactor guanylyltransferase [Aggregatilineales bacterium]
MSSVSIAILAGGRSSRMGTDKSFVLLQDKPIFEHVLARVLPLGLPMTLITNSPEKYAKYHLQTVADILLEQGALGGLYTAIISSSTDYTLCVACDMPFLNTALLKNLIDRRANWDVVVPRTAGFPEAMHAVYSQACLEPIRRQLTKGQLKASGFYDRVKTLYVEEAEIRSIDPALRSFINVNTPDDLAAVQRLD